MYFLEQGARYDETKENVYLDYIPMAEIKSVFVKQEQLGIVSMENLTPPLVRNFSQLASFKTPSFNVKSNKESRGKTPVDKSPASRRGHEFQIETFEEDSLAAESTGECSGRSYHIRVDSEDDCQSIVTKISKIHRKCRSDAERKGRLTLMQRKILKYYKTPLFQTIIAGLILAVNFPMVVVVVVCVWWWWGGVGFDYL